MYNIENLNLGSNLKRLRVSRGLSLEALGNKICKTKTTVSKYEKNEISLDVITLLEICNALDCNISQFINEEHVNDEKYIIKNPFGTNILYVYYITGKKLITSVLELVEQDKNVSVKLFNAIRDINKYANEYSYSYNGELTISNTIARFSLLNEESKGQREQVNITANISWEDNAKVFSGFVSGLTPNALPVTKKCIITKVPITNIENYKTDLLISDDELENISKNNAWILENANYSHFFLDF